MQSSECAHYLVDMEKESNVPTDLSKVAIRFTTLFNIFLERIMTDVSEDHEGTVRIGGRTITNLRLADNIDGLA